RLGQGDTLDLLCVSFSCNDAVGHSWGPDSQEVLDVTLRSDLIVKELLAHLDARVGKGRYVLALTGDHGVCPIVDVARRAGEDAGRIGPGKFLHAAEEFLKTTYGKGDDNSRWVEAFFEPSLYLDRETVRQHGLKLSAVEEALAGWAKKQ